MIAEESHNALQSSAGFAQNKLEACQIWRSAVVAGGMGVDMMVAEQSGMVVKKINVLTYFQGNGEVFKNGDSSFYFFSFSMQLSWVFALIQ